MKTSTLFEGGCNEDHAMGEHICGINGVFLPLPSLRLMMSPLRLVSAAIWQTVQQRHVMDYGMLEEFVTMVTEVVPELLNNSQRAQLILGLRARLVLELCHSKPIADIETIQPHLERIQTLTPLWGTQATDAEVGLSESNFLVLVQTLLKDPEEREHFFQDVFPVEFGPIYDTAIQKLMWQFLSRLEKLLPVSNFQQAASLLSDVPSVLEECLESVSHPQQLKTLLQYHRDLDLLNNHDTFVSSDGDRILSALCLPPVERVVVTAEQTESGEQGSSMNVYVDTLSKELEVESATQTEYTEVQSGTSVIVIKREEGLECEKNEKVSLGTEEKEPVYKTVMVIGEDGRKESLVRNKPKRDQNNAGDMLHGNKCGKPIPSQMNRIDLSDNIILSMLHKSSVELQRIDTTNLTFPFGPETFKHSHTLQTHQRPCLLGTQQQEELPSGEGKTAFTTYEEEIAQSSIDHRTCKVCGKTVYRIGYLSTHMKIHSENHHYLIKEVKTVQKPSSNGCNMEPSSGIPLDAIPKDSDSSSINTLEDPPCNPGPSQTKIPKDSDSSSVNTLEDPSYKSNLVEHKKSQSDDRPCLCCECGKAFFTNIDLQNHRQTSHSEKSKQYGFPCRHCGKLFRHRKSCANHEKSKHEGVRYPCSYCGKPFVSAHTLKRHDLIHTGERPFKCNHNCDKAFRSKTELIIHMRYHTGERPFKCDVCGKGFVQANFLTTHYRIHTGEKPYSCSLCDKSFNNHNCLKRHMATHSNEKPHKCLDCGKMFQRRTLLNVHQRSCTVRSVNIWTLTQFS